MFLLHTNMSSPHQAQRFTDIVGVFGIGIGSIDIPLFDIWSTASAFSIVIESLMHALIYEIFLVPYRLKFL